MPLHSLDRPGELLERNLLEGSSSILRSTGKGVVDAIGASNFIGGAGSMRLSVLLPVTLRPGSICDDHRGCSVRLDAPPK